MFTNFSNPSYPPGPENPGEYANNYETHYGPIRPSQSQSWRQPHGHIMQRGPGMAGPLPYERERYRVPYNGPYAAGFNQGPPHPHRPFTPPHLGLDPYGHYAPLQLQAPDFTPNAANAGPSPLERQRVLRPFQDQMKLFTDFNAPEALKSMEVVFEVSARRIEINWTPPEVPANVRYSYKVEVIDGNDRSEYDKPWHNTSQCVRTVPGNHYEIIVRCVLGKEKKLYAETRKTVKAVFSMEEMRKLYLRALDTIGTNMHSFYFLYRCKPQAYWDDIYNNCQGIMEKYLKDNNGQPANAINGVISGLFFSARTLPDGNLPYQSPFGNRRLRMEAPILLNATRHCMYFADYYCNYHTHYVTVVICRKNSDTDRYCSPRLIRLNPEKNPFLRIEYHPPTRNLPEGGHMYYVNKNVWVEVYYTESINLHGVNLDYIEATGAGTSRIGGLPNNKQCEQCNLYPMKVNGGEDGEDTENDMFNYMDLNCSTFSLLTSMKEQKTILGADWEEVVDTICHLVDGVCEMAETTADDRDPLQQSMDRLNDAMKEMDEQIDYCQDVEVLAIADDMRSMVNVFKDRRGGVAQMIEETLNSLRLVQSSMGPTITPFVLPSAPLPGSILGTVGEKPVTVA